MRFSKFSRAVMVFVAVSILGGCGAMNAQNTGITYKPANATTDAEGNVLMLKGYDVVSYSVDNKDALGRDTVASECQEMPVQFASTKPQALFSQAATRYSHDFGGNVPKGR